MTSQTGVDSSGGYTLKTLPEYGGHLYRFESGPDGWKIVRVD